MTRKYLIHIFVLLAAALLLPGPETAQGAVAYGEFGQLESGRVFWPEGSGLGSGRLRFFPELAVGVVYDDNIYYDEANEESDLVSHVIPRLMLDYSLEERGSVKLGYTGEFAFYRDLSDNDWRRHDLGFLLDYNAPGGLFLDIADDFVDTTDPFGSREDYALGQQKERWYNLFGVGLGYGYSDTIRLIGYFNYNSQEYENENIDWSQNFDEDEYGLGLEKRVSDKTWSFVRYLHGSRDYNTGAPDGMVDETNDADYSTDRVYLGLTWDATSRITGELNFGYQWLEYDNRLGADDLPYEDNETWLAATMIDYALKPGVTDVHARLERGTFQRGSFTRDYFDGTYLNVWLQHRFYNWYRLKFNLGLGRNEYNTDRQDDDIRAGVGLEYLLWRRWTLALGYDYTNRDSNAAGASFTINRVIGTVTLRY